MRLLVKVSALYKEMPMPVNRFRKTGWFAVIMLLLASQQVQAINYFWIFRLFRNLEITVRAFGRMTESTQVNSAASMDLLPMTPGSGRSETRAWSINGVMRRYWPRQSRMYLESSAYSGSCHAPVGDVYSSGFSATGYSGSGSVLVFATQSQLLLQLPSLLPDFFLTRLFAGEHFFTPRSFYRHKKTSSSLPWLCLEGLSLAGQQSAIQTSAVEKILQSLVPVNSDTHASDSPLVQLIPGISGIQAAEGSDDNYTPNQQTASLLSCLFDTGATGSTVSMFFSPLYNIYLGLSGSANTAEAHMLVPHEVVVNLGMIPGADPENPVHLNPDYWKPYD